PREYELLEYMVRNHDVTLTKEILVQKIWESDYKGYDNTVMVHISHLREKIEDDPANPHFIKTVKGRGYYFDSEG
ncbi:MAG: helix-turn-helix domain-containing protein, partial [Lachnospiraceae bacterium]|nr:helix-turn-helix domain-containing protein [Lachnospiraceae bacterium]